MSEEVTAIDNNGENLSVDDSKENVDEVAVASAVDAEGASLDQPDQSSIQQIEELPNPVEKSEPEEKVSEDISVTKETEEKCDIKHSATEDKVSEDTTVSEETEEKHGIKRRASAAFSVEASSEEFKGFDQINADDSVVEFNRVLVRIESEVKTAIENITPVKSVTISSSVPVKASKRLRQDTDGSRPSSALSSRSDGDGITSSTDVGSATSSPAQRGRRTIEISSPLLRVPLDRGWRRELVYRANLDAHARRNSDIYYYTPHGKKLRSMREISENLSGTGLTLENFSFFKEPLGVDDPEREIIRDARMMRRVESPVAHPPPVVEGKRTPKPKAPKGASPDPPIKSPPAKIKVKSFGSRLNNNSSPTPTSTKQKNAITPGTDNNNSAAWKKPSEDRRRNRLANGASSPPGASIRRRGRTKDETDYFSSFFARAKERNYNVGVQIFQYLGMRDLAHCARVCKLWQELAGTPVLWRHVRMKNSQVSDWGGLCAALKRNGTKRLDLRKMLQPQIDTAFWEQFAQNIGTVNTLETIEMCRCPASAVEAVCRGLPGLRAFSALAIKDDLLDPSPLGTLTMLHELRLKSIAGLSLTRDLRPLATLTNLHHLSLTSIKELGWCACDVIGELPQLESLELGECTFRAEFALVLRKLTRLRRLRLERGTAQCAAPELLRALAHLPHLTKLELVNVDVKVGFDDALAECKNIQRLLIIPTYVSQSATTNKQVLSGVLRLKDTLTHLMWGVTIELLRVTELFIDQCEQSGETKKKDIGECIPVLKPVPGGRLSEEHHQIAGPPQVEILPLPRLQRLLSTQLPNTKLKLLRIPFHATWRQSLADFQ